MGAPPTTYPSSDIRRRRTTPICCWPSARGLRAASPASAFSAARAAASTIRWRTCKRSPLSPNRGGVGFLFGDDWTAAAVKNGTLGFPAGLSGTVSVFALGSPARGVYLAGLYYPLHDATLTPAWPLGVSNAFTGAPAAVTVKDGVLTVLWNGRTLPSAAAERPLVIE